MIFIFKTACDVEIYHLAADFLMKSADMSVWIAKHREAVGEQNILRCNIAMHKRKRSNTFQSNAELNKENKSFCFR